jgi:hypothetical protein
MLEASLSYIARERPVWATEQDPVSKKQKSKSCRNDVDNRNSRRILKISVSMLKRHGR